MKWIKSSDQQPPKDRSFLCITTLHSEPRFGIYDYWDNKYDGKAYWHQCCSTCCCNYSLEKGFYWMELPEMPDE